MTQIYAVRISPGIVKIGVAKDAWRRLNSLEGEIQKWRPDISLTLLHTEDVEWYRPRLVLDIERAALAELAAKQLPYKWFAANGLPDTNCLGPTEWFKAADIEAICAIKAGVIQPLLSSTISPRLARVMHPWCVPTCHRFEYLFGEPLTEYLIKREKIDVVR